MARKKSEFSLHQCPSCPEWFKPVSHHCPSCPDFDPAWRGTASDHLLLHEAFNDRTDVIHERRPGFCRDLTTGIPTEFVAPPETRVFLTPYFETFTVPWASHPMYLLTGRPHQRIEEAGVDVIGACAITGLSLAAVRNRCCSVRVNDGGLHELFMKCRRADGRYSPKELWDFRIDILDSQVAQRERRRRRAAFEAFLAEREREGLPIDPQTYGRAYAAGAREEEPRFPLGD